LRSVSVARRDNRLMGPWRPQASDGDRKTAGHSPFYEDRSGRFPGAATRLKMLGAASHATGRAPQKYEMASREHGNPQGVGRKIALAWTCRTASVSRGTRRADPAPSSGVLLGGRNQRWAHIDAERH
jgi:hypothetical protein